MSTSLAQRDVPQTDASSEAVAKPEEDDTTSPSKEKR